MTNSKLHSRNFKFKSDYDYSLQLIRWFLKPIGAWPEINESSVVENIFVPIQIFICWTLVISILGPCILYILFEARDISSVLHAIGPLIHRTISSVNYMTLLKRRGDIRNMMEQMRLDWQHVQNNDDREIMLQQAKFGRFIAGICGIIMHGACFLFCLSKAMKTVTIVVDNQTLTIRPLTCPAYRKIIDTRFSPTNEIMVVVMFLTTIIASFSTAGICSLAAVFATHACGQLNVLYSRLGELGNDDEGNHLTEQKIANIVEHHLKVLGFVSRMESIMHKACLVEVMGCTMIMCLLGYYFIMNLANFDAAKITSYIITYTSMSFNVFIFCYIAEILTEQCKNVGEMAYMTNWYKLPHKTAIDLILIIEQSNKVIKITAGKLFQLSIATFGDVVKTSVAYLNILRTIAA